MDGNGRMGRLWQTLILKELNPVFEYLPVESLVKDRQSDYYSALGKSDKSGKSTDFVEFMLEIIDESLKFLIETQRVTLTAQDRISLFKDIIKSRYFTRQDYLRHFKNISPATASRDLKFGVEKAVLKKSGDKRTTKYSYN
jgi:Fic family protein